MSAQESYQFASTTTTAFGRRSSIKKDLKTPPRK